MIEFLLNRARHQYTAASADVTLLDYLREHLHRCGTKEGCASGDCGACTVVVAAVDPDGDTLAYRAVNACITFAGSLDGKQLLTVEDLADESGLHPVQQAMLDQHGSQCGFCTPGFVMSMFALWKNVAANNVARPVNGDWVPVVEEHLGGNLCRCTGYRPIVDACVTSLETIEPDQFDRGSRQTIDQLQSLRKNAAGCSDRLFFLPKSLSELDELLVQFPRARLLAGGTDLALEVTQQLKQLSPIVSLQHVAELNEVATSEDEMRIGAGVSLSECQRVMTDLSSDLAELLRRFGSTPVRNQGTLGGNIANASPIGDLPPVLLALNAELVLYGKGQQRTVAIDDFFTGYRETVLQPGEIVRAVVIRDLGKYRGPEPASRLCIYKISKRLDDDISAVCMAVAISLQNNRVTNIRVAFGGMAATPGRATSVEAALQDQHLDDDSVLGRAQTALDADFDPIDDVRASAQYRLQVAKNLLLRLRYEVIAPIQCVQIADYEH